MHSILKQSAWLFFAQGLARVIGFFYIIYLAKTLGVSNFGLYSVALAYFAIFSTFAEFGFNRFLVREISLNISKVNSLVFNVTVIKLIITTLFYLMFVATLYLIDPDKLRWSIIIITALAVFPAAVAQALDSVFVARQKLQYSALSLLATQIVTASLGVFFLSRGSGIHGVVAALIIGQTFYVLSLFLILKTQKINFFAKLELGKFKKILFDSIPYAILGILGLLYFRIDMIILSYLKGNFETGIYAAAYRFFETASLIPSTISIALFPVLAKLHEQSKLELKKIYYKSLILMGIPGLLIMTVVITISPYVIQYFLPNYYMSINALLVLSLSIPFLFMIAPQGAVFLTTERLLKPIIYISIFNLFFNATLNFILIPKYSYMGSAWATVFSDILGFLIFFFYLKVLFNKDK